MPPEPRRYADQLVDWLAEAGYTHCFFVGGGNIMHLLDAVRTRMVCIPVVHEVTACIAAEYFTEMSRTKAFALVTAGPGLTNTMTAVASCWVESRELLVLGGQVKTSDLARGRVRQMGHQEIDGRAMCEPVSKAALTIDRAWKKQAFLQTVAISGRPRKGPVVLEVCLDVAAGPPVPIPDSRPDTVDTIRVGSADVTRTAEGLLAAERPVLLLGGGVDWSPAAAAWDRLDRLGLPVAATWNGADRVPADLTGYLGRPNTYGMRWSNILIQQADVLVALGTRLGLQQTGFATDRFAAGAHITQVDIDAAELDKDRPGVEVGLQGDAGDFLTRLLDKLEERIPPGVQLWPEWRRFCHDVQKRLPVVESNTGNLVDPFAFVRDLGQDLLTGDDLIVPCSSGNTFNVVMQTLPVKRGQRVLTDKGAASMGYGLAGAIGAALAGRGRRVIHLEGDGGFAQNLQELGTVAVQGLNIKTFLFANDGYASIRQMQRNYFNGDYLGCDRSTGIGLPDWPALAAAFGIPAHTIDPADPLSDEVRRLLREPGPVLFIVPVDPEQTHWPKITSEVAADGQFTSNPLHRMTPYLPDDVAQEVLAHLDENARR